MTRAEAAVLADLVAEATEVGALEPSTGRALSKALEGQWCVHCDLRPAAYRDGVCKRCRLYRYRTGSLPPDEVIQATLLRDEERRMRGVA